MWELTIGCYTYFTTLARAQIERKIFLMRCTLIRWSMAQFALEHEKLPNRSCVHSANHGVYT